MSNRTIRTNDLKPGTIYMVRGKLEYARLASQIKGEELQRDINRRQSRGWMAITTPYTTATISNPQIICKDPNNLTPEEKYANESIYTGHSNGQAVYMFSARNRGRFLPYIAQYDATNKQATQVQPEGELAHGLDVTLVMRVYEAKPNNGVSLEGVFVNEPIRYYNANTPASELRALGITFIPLETQQKQLDEINDAPAQQAPAQQNTQPQDNPFSAQPQQFSSQQSMPQFAGQQYAPQAPTMPQNMSGIINNGGMQFNPQGQNQY